MSYLQIFLKRACQELGLTIVMPFCLMVRDDIQINALALLPQLGAPRGMIVVSSYEDLCGAASELHRLGYGYSALDEPPLFEPYDIDTYVDMFSDWGWGNNWERKPDWMKK